MNPNEISVAACASSTEVDVDVDAHRFISCNVRSKTSRPRRAQQHQRPRPNVTLTMLTSACVLIALAVCSPHHRIRHDHHHLQHHGNDLGELQFESMNTGNGNQSEVVYEVAYPGQGGAPPSYLILMYESMASRSKYMLRKHRTATVDGMESEEMDEHSEDESQKLPIIRALMPVQIANSVRNSKIEYSLSQKSLGDFNRANIILTLKDEVNLADDGSLLTIVVSIKDYEVQHSLKIREGSKFYSFDVTTLLQKHVQDGNDDLEQTPEADPEEAGVPEGAILRVECTVTEPGTGKPRQFSDIFDTNSEAPFILLRFQHIHLSNGVRPSPHHRGNENGEQNAEQSVRRQKRSPQAHPTAAAATATGIPGISPKEEPIGECTCPNPTHHTFSFLPLPTAAMLPVPADFRSESDSANSPRYEYEVTPTGPSTGAGNVHRDNRLPLPALFNMTFSGPSSNRSRPRNFSSRRYASAKLTLTGPNAQGTSPRPYSSKGPTSPTVCKRHEWMVKPSDISLDDVIRPEYLDLGYCGGTCPFPLRNDVYNYTMHSYFVDQHRFFNGFATPANLEHSKCIPVTYKKLMVMMKEPDGGFAVIVYDDASVETCGCR